MNVVPALTADRAESVLHDIRHGPGPLGVRLACRYPGRRTEGLVAAEPETNDLLDKGDQAKAAAKFAE